MANKQIKDFTQKNNVDTTDQILIQESGGTTKKTTQAEMLKTTGDVTVFRGTTKEFELGDEVFEGASSGVYSFGGLSINGGDNTKYDIGLVDGHIVDFNAGTYDKVEYAGGTALTPATANGVTYVLFDKAGLLSTQTTAPTDQDRRDKIYVGRVVTIAGTVVQTQDEPVLILNPANKIYDLAKAIRIFNIEGNLISANGANLNINKSAGSLFSIGANFTTNNKQPNRVSIAGSTASTFAYITQTAGSTEADTTLIDPTYYDNAGTKTLIGGAGQQATVQRIYLFPSGNIRVAYGQEIHPKLSDALQSISTESFVINPNIPGNGVLIGLLAVRKDATDLSDPLQARFLEASRFGEGNIGAGGQSVSSLQNAYDNSGEPEILVTDTTEGAVTIKDSATNTNRDNILEVKDTSDNVVFGVQKGDLDNNSNALVCSGFWTPTVSSTANVDSTITYNCFYQRIGKVVSCSILIVVDATSAGNFNLGLSLPIASNFTAIRHAQGSFSSGFGEGHGLIEADFTNDIVRMKGNTSSTGSVTYSGTFQYYII